MLLSVICKYEGCVRRTQILSGYCVVHDSLKRLLGAKRNMMIREGLSDKRNFGGKRNVECECVDCGDKILSGMNNNRLRCVECGKQIAKARKNGYAIKKERK